MSRAVMQQAFDALVNRFNPKSWTQKDDAVAALREELAKPELMRMPKKGDRIVFTEDGFTGVVESISPAGGPFVKFDDGTDGQWSLYDFGTMFHYADNGGRP